MVPPGVAGLPPRTLRDVEHHRVDGAEQLIPQVLARSRDRLLARPARDPQGQGGSTLTSGRWRRTDQRHAGGSRRSGAKRGAAGPGSAVSGDRAAVQVLVSGDRAAVEVLVDGDRAAVEVLVLVLVSGHGLGLGLARGLARGRPVLPDTDSDTDSDTDTHGIAFHQSASAGRL